MKRILCLTVTSMILMVGFAFAGTVNLPRTGQTKCYDSAGMEIPCAGTGQDGDIQAGVPWPEPRFTDNGDDTMTDNLTGLMWIKNANLSGASITWQKALGYCNYLTHAGYSDWRLPNLNELESLVNANAPNSYTWLNSQGFTSVQGNEYWSSTSYASYPGDAWIVIMWDGDVDDKNKSSYFYVWPVRGGQCGQFVDSAICLPQTGQTECYNMNGTEIPCKSTGQDGDIQAGMDWPELRFTDNGDDTMTDNLTGLMWTKNANLPNEYMDWQQALNYVAGMNAGMYPNYDYHDWRLSNVNELESLLNANDADPANWLNNHGFINVQADYYWSSTSYANFPLYAWIVHMWYGHVSANNKSINIYVWPVRGGQSGPLDHWVISGAIMHRGSGLQNVTMTLSGDASMTTATGEDGTYSFTNLSNGTYVITPSKSGYKFWPKSRSITISDSDVSDQNFRGIKLR